MAIVKLPKLPTVPKAKLVPSVGGGHYDTARSIWVPGASASSSTPTVPSSSPAPPPSGGLGGFDYGGDLTPQIDPNAYLTQLQGDPMSQNADVAFNAAIGSGRSALADQIKQLVIRGGWDLRSKLPSGLSQYAGDIDQATLDAANANPLSARAQLNDQLQRGQSDLAYNLAARGVGNSGGFATGNTQLQQGYDQATNTGMNQLLDAIGQGAAGFGALSSNATAARNAAYEAAAQRLAQLQASGPARMTPGGNSLDRIAAALPGDTGNTLAQSILGTPNFDYGGLDRALKVPTYEDILNSLPSVYR